MEDVRDEEKKSDENENLALNVGHKWVTLSAMALVWQGKRKGRGTFSWLWLCERKFFGGKGFRLNGEYYDWQGLELLLLSLSHRPYRQYPFGWRWFLWFYVYSTSCVAIVTTLPNPSVSSRCVPMRWERDMRKDCRCWWWKIARWKSKGEGCEV